MFQQVEFTIGDRCFRAEKLDVFQQFDVARKLAPVLTGALDLLVVVLKGAGGAMFGPPGTSVEDAEKQWQESRAAIRQLFETKVTDIAGPLARALAAMPDADARFVLMTCLSKVSIQHGTVWAPLMTPTGILAYQDMDMPTMLKIAWQIVQVNIAPFSAGPRGGSPSAGPK